jgi:hypothetical protein
MEVSKRRFKMGFITYLHLLILTKTFSLKPIFAKVNGTFLKNNLGDMQLNNEYNIMVSLYPISDEKTVLYSGFIFFDLSGVHSPES